MAAFLLLFAIAGMVSSGSAQASDSDGDTQSGNDPFLRQGIFVP